MRYVGALPDLQQAARSRSGWRRCRSPWRPACRVGARPWPAGTARGPVRTKSASHNPPTRPPIPPVDRQVYQSEPGNGDADEDQSQRVHDRRGQATEEKEPQIAPALLSQKSIARLRATGRNT